MPEVIDNVKVGLFIKQLLKDHHMTQDDLAEKLSVTKSAVSQNLNGKSSFDVHNLMRVASLFELTLDDLLNCRIPAKDENVAPVEKSEYERVLKRGIEEFQKIPSTDVQIKTPDLYGKVLMDYILETENLQFFHYILDKEIRFVEDYYHRAQPLYARVLLFSLQHQTGHEKAILKAYGALTGTLAISDSDVEKEVWSIISTSKSHDLLDTIRTHQMEVKGSSFLKSTKKVPLLSISQWIRITGSYQLMELASYLIEHHMISSSYLEEWVHACLHSRFYSGIQLFLETYYPKTMGWSERRVVIQPMMLQLIQYDELPLFRYCLKMSFHGDGTALFIAAYQQKKEVFIEMLVQDYFWALNFQKIGLQLIQDEAYSLLLAIKERLTPDILNYLLAHVDEYKTEAMLFLLDLGAEFSLTYYNSQTMKKFNHLLTYFRTKGDH